jgi:hypothetical protein
MKNTSTNFKVLLILFFLSFFIFFIIANKALAQTCAEKYPGSGKCIKTDGICEYCPVVGNEECIDLSANLCPATEGDQQCCYKTTVEEQTGLQLQIPIFKYTKAKSLADYIKTIYKYGLYILVPIGIVIIIIGGIMWILAGGDMPKIKRAKQYISGALTGILIGLLSYVILSFVGITTLINPSPENIEPIEVDIPSSDFEMPIVDYATGTTGAAYPSVGGQCLPVAANSFYKPSWNWGSPRKYKGIMGKRCHAGLDLYTKSPGYAVAMADGTVTNVQHFYACTRGDTQGVVVYHASLGVTAIYGEINSGTVKVNKGQTIKAGQILGIATNCGMVHFELYKGVVSRNGHWFPPAIITQSNECRTKYLSTKPPSLMDPTDTIKSLLNKKCGS